MPIPMTTTRRRRRLILAQSVGALLAITAISPLAQAGQIWDGGGGNGLWSNSVNWNLNTAPAFGTPIEFAGLLQLLSSNDATASVAGITFNAGAGTFTLSGMGVTMTGGLLNNSASTQTVSFASITLGGAQTFDASAGDLTVTPNVALGANTLTIDGANRTTLNGVLSGTGGLIKNGTGILGLTGMNIYSGTTLINAGVLQSITPGSLSPNSDFTVTGTGILDLVSSDSTIQALNDGGMTTGRVSNSAATSATLTLGNNGASGSFGGTIEAFGTGPLGITKIGAGTQTLSGDNTYTGPTTVNGGTLKAGAPTIANIRGAFGVNSTVTMANVAGATLDITGFDTQIGSITGGGLLGGNVALGAAKLTLGADNTSPVAYAGSISSTGMPAISVVKIGTGTQTLSGSSTYTGATVLERGGLFANSNTALGAGTLRITSAGGATTLGSDVVNTALANPISVESNFSLVAPATGNHNFFLNGAMDLNGATRVITGRTHQGQFHFGGVISDGGLTLATAGLAAGTPGNDPYVAFIFDSAATHTYTGLTTVGTGAYLVFQSAGEKLIGDVLIEGNGVVDYLGFSNQISNTSKVTVNSSGSSIIGATVFQGLELFNNSDTIGSLFGTGTVGLGDGSLTVGAGNFTGVITDGERGTLPIGGSFTKNTGGTLKLAGANVYTGTTTVTGGTLNVTGSLTSTTINVTGGTFIAGKATTLAPAAAVTVATGAGFEYHAVANAPLTIGTLTLNAGLGTTIGGSIGSTLTGAEIIVTGDVIPTAGAIRVNVFGVPGIATGTPGTYTLLTAGAGSTLNVGTTYTIGDVFNATNFTVSAVGATATTITATIVAAVPLTEAYWLGQSISMPGVWSASNWASDSMGTATSLVPSAGTAVFFSAGAPAMPADPGSMTLGTDMSIGSLTVNAPGAPETRAITLENTGGNTLTIATVGGITINAGAGAVTLKPAIILGASQTWTNNSSNPLTVSGAVSNGANTLTVAGTGDTSLTGILGAGAGGLMKTGPGTLTLTRNNTYAGDTHLLGGAIFADVAPAATTNTSFGTGTLVIAGGTRLGSHIANQTIQNDISVIDPGTPITFDATTGLNLTGDINLNGGVHTFTGGAALSEIRLRGAISNGGVTLNSPVNYTAFIYGTGSGADAPNTYTGLTTVNDNVYLVLNKGGLNGAIRGNVIQNGTGSLDYFQSDQISDTASVTINGPGNFLGPDLYAGLQLNDNTETIGALFGASTGIVQLGSGHLTVGAGNFAGVIADGFSGTGGQLTKNTAGTLTLTGASTFTGNTNINNGTLVLNGSVRSPTVFVNFAGTLMGTGTAFRNVVNAGVFSPGQGIGTFRVGGNYTQTGAGTLVVEIAGPNAGQHDLVAVGGHAALDGNLRIVKVGNARLKVGEKVTFLTAGGGVSGTFAAVENEFNTGTIVSAGVVYDGNSVALQGAQGSFQDFATRAALTVNQRAVASALDNVVGDSKHRRFIEYLNNRQLTDLPRDFDLIAPEEIAVIHTIGIAQASVQGGNIQRRLRDIRTGVQDFSASGLAVSGMMPTDSELPPIPANEQNPEEIPQYSGPPTVLPPGTMEAPASALIGPVDGVQGPTGNGGRELSAPAGAKRHFGTFITGVGEFAHVGDTTNAGGYDLTSGGFTIGADCRLGENFAVGLSVGYARSSADLSNNGRVTADGAKLGAYATYFAENLYIDAAIQAGYNTYDTRRSALQGVATGSTSGGDFTGLIAGGYDFLGEAVRIGPTASFQYTHIGIGSFSETGSLAPLTYGSQGADSMRVALGLKMSYDWQLGSVLEGVLIRPELRLAWQHEYGDASYAIDSSLGGAGRGAFTVQGPAIGRDSLLLGIGVAVLWSQRTSTYVYYDGEIGRENYDAHNVSGGMRLQF